MVDNLAIARNANGIVRRDSYLLVGRSELANKPIRFPGRNIELRLPGDSRLFNLALRQCRTRLLGSDARARSVVAHSACPVRRAARRDYRPASVVDNGARLIA